MPKMLAAAGRPLGGRVVSLLLRMGVAGAAECSASQAILSLSGPTSKVTFLSRERGDSDLETLTEGLVRCSPPAPEGEGCPCPGYGPGCTAGETPIWEPFRSP